MSNSRKRERETPATLPPTKVIRRDPEIPPNENNLASDSSGEDYSGEDYSGEDYSSEDYSGEDSSGEDSSGEDSSGKKASGEDSSGKPSGEDFSGVKFTGKKVIPYDEEYDDIGHDDEYLLEAKEYIDDALVFLSKPKPSTYKSMLDYLNQAEQKRQNLRAYRLPLEHGGFRFKGKGGKNIYGLVPEDVLRELEDADNKLKDLLRRSLRVGGKRSKNKSRRRDKQSKRKGKQSKRKGKQSRRKGKRGKTRRTRRKYYT
jgi:hypothetical protein